MKPSRLLAAGEIALLLAAVTFALSLPASPFTFLDLVWFVIGLSVLKLSDVWLPRGDAAGMSAALALGALLLFDLRVVLAALVIAELVALVPRGRSQKWASAVASLTSEAIAGVACHWLLVALGLQPGRGVLVGGGAALRPEQYASLVFVGVLFASLEFGLIEIQTALRDGQPVMPSVLGSLSYGGWLVAAQASAGILAALMYRSTGAWGLVVSVVMILLMRQSFMLLLEIGGAYDATINVLVGAMEARLPGREGAAERNAELCTRIGRAIGLHGRDLQTLRYAALLLEVGAEEAESSARGGETRLPSAKIVEGVEFLRDVVPILALCGESGELEPVSRTQLVSSYVVLAVAAATGTAPIRRRDFMRGRVSPRIAREVDTVVAVYTSNRTCGAIGA